MLLQAPCVSRRRASRGTTRIPHHHWTTAVTYDPAEQVLLDFDGDCTVCGWKKTSDTLHDRHNCRAMEALWVARCADMAVRIDVYAVYVIECNTPKHVYVGITRNIARRLYQHRAAQGSEFTKKHGVHSVLRIQFVYNERAALKLEDEWTSTYKAFGFTVAGANGLSRRRQTDPRFRANLRRGSRP